MKMLNSINIKNLGFGFILILSVLGLSACSSPEDKANSYYENGMRLLEKNELGKANVEFRNAFQLDRTMTKAIWGQVLVAEKKGNHRLTYKLLSAVLISEPQHVQALVKIGRLLLVAGKIDKALEKSDASLKVAPDDLAVLAFRASVLFKLSDTEGAVKLAKQVIAKDPTYVDALIVLAIERLGAKDDQKAIEYLDQGLKSNDKNIVLQLIKVKALDNLAKLDLAEDVFKRLIDYYPGVPSFNYALAQFYLKHDRKDDAEGEFRRVIKNKPKDLAAKIKLVQFLSVTKDTEAAKAQLIEFVNQSPDNYDLKFTLVQFYISQKQIALAQQTIAGIISGSNDADTELKAKGIKAGLFLTQNDKDMAEKVVDNILSQDSHNENALILKSNINIDRQQYDTAIADLRVVLRDTPTSSRALFLLAKAHYLSGSPELADEQYFKAFKSSRFNAGYGQAYARFLLKRNQPARAEKVLLNVLSVSPRNIAVMRLLAQTRLNLGDWLGAQETAENIKSLGDKSNTSEQISNAILVGKKDYNESISLLKKVYESTPDNIRPVVALVRTYLLAGKSTEAGNFLDAVVNASPKNTNARILRGQVYLTQGLTDKAIATYKEVISLAPDNTAGYYNLATSYIRLKDYDKANSTIKNGLVASPNNFLLQLTQANVYEQVGKFNDAIAIYENLLKIRPGADIIANNLASLLTENRTDKVSLDRAYALSKRFKRTEVPQFKDTFGWASYRVGKYSDASDLLESAAEGLPSLPVIQYHLGMNYLAKEDNKLARKSFEKALELAGDTPFSQADEIRAALDKL